ncbi:MAG: AAA family ATPase [Inquilinus sp.]|uniref:AAA family ATPase n=1 Tax=Inquilinus sp. TaxID=1932117 RepID=UPI003F3CFBEF
MLTVAIVSQKGGSGKTTLAVHLGSSASRAGYVSCIIDTDPQATAAAWGDWRGGEDPEVITTPPARLAKTLSNTAELGAEVVIIDTPPHADAAAREAAKASDLILIPCRPRAFDLHAIRATADLVKFSGKPGFVVFNAAPPRAPSLFSEAAGLVEEIGLRVSPVVIADRAAFHHGTAAGKTAVESDPLGRAAEEMHALWLWACERVNMPARKHERKSRSVQS